MLQLQASKLVNRKNKAKQDKNSNIPQQNPNLDMSNVKEENICFKVAIKTYSGYFCLRLLILLKQTLNNDYTTVYTIDCERLLHLDSGISHPDQHWHKDSFW